MTPNSVQSNTILVKVVGVLYLQGKLAKIQKSTEEEPMYFRVIIHLLTSVVMDSRNRITICLKRKTLIVMNCASQ